MKKIKTVAVVGAGTMGSAIAQKYAQEGFEVFLNDRDEKYIRKGLEGIESMLGQGVERGIFSREKMDGIMANITGTTDQNDLKNCDMIVEAVFEDFDVKFNLFKTLDEIVSSETILATNTSSFSVTELSKAVSNPENFIGLHYFYHAAKNRLVEIIPGEKTSAETYRAVEDFSKLSGKDPIKTKDAYGFAVNRFFVPWLNESVKMLDEGLGSIEEIEVVTMKAFGLGMGPFALMNATGVPIALHAQRTLEHFGPSYKVSSLLDKQVDIGENWEIPELENIVVEEAKEKAIKERILGAVFFVCSQILDEEICTAVDLNRGARIGLRWRKGPVDMMQRTGETEVKRLVQKFASLYNEDMPPGISRKNWEMEFVTLEKKGSKAIITMSKPEDMNVLDEVMISQLDEKFTLANSDPSLDTIIITGSGKAFVAGADVRFFISNMKKNSLDEIVKFTGYGQQVFDKIDHSEKKVVALLNGLTLGGGMELALCADQIFAVPKAKIAFPETGIGIYPGLGGTQRTADRVGKGLTKYLVLTGSMISAKDAVQIKLVDGLVQPSEMLEILGGDRELPSSEKAEKEAKWSSLDSFFEHNSYKNIIKGDYTDGEMDEQSISKLGKIMSRKAPLAMQFAEDLIQEGKGPESELEKLKNVFSTKDALLGLSSIGKKVEFKGE